MNTIVQFSFAICLFIAIGLVYSVPAETNQWWVTASCNGYCYKFDHYGCANCCVGGRILSSSGANKGKYGKCDEYKRCLCDTIGINKDSKYGQSSSSNYYDQKQSGSSYYPQQQSGNKYQQQQSGNQYYPPQTQKSPTSNYYPQTLPSSNFGQTQRQPLPLDYWNDEA